MIVILAMAAFAVDIGYIILVRAQLQKAADAAALAAVEQLMQPYVQYSSPGRSRAQQTQILNNAEAAGLAQAKRFAAFNRAGNVRSLALNDADVVFGFLDAQNGFSPNPPDTRFPNTVQVTVRRDAAANGLLTLIFGSVLGKGTASVTATAQATMMSDPPDFTDVKGVNGLLLPLAVDVRVWKQFLQDGTSPPGPGGGGDGGGGDGGGGGGDGGGGNGGDGGGNQQGTGSGQVHLGPDGSPQLQLYATASESGRSGLVAIGPPTTDVTTFGSWIANGPSPDDLRYLNAHNLLPVSAQQPQYWPPGPSLNSTLQSDFARLLGVPRLIVLYDGSMPAARGYPVVGFAGVTISQVTGSGSDVTISVQPTFVLDPTGVGGSPTGSSGQPPTFSFAPPRLTR
jgi:Flp pilus assembly protein TadG